MKNTVKGYIKAILGIEHKFNGKIHFTMVIGDLSGENSSPSVIKFTSNFTGSFYVGEHITIDPNRILSTIEQ